MVELANGQDGVYGARMTGGGFGGLYDQPCGRCSRKESAAKTRTRLHRKNRAEADHLDLRSFRRRWSGWRNLIGMRRVGNL